MSITAISDIRRGEGQVLQYHILKTKKIVIHKKVGPIVQSLSYRVHRVIELRTSKQGSHF